MSDPIEKLTGLGNALEGAPMPLPASEIRARGDRIRRRHHALLAGAGAFAVAAVAVPVIALTGDGGSDPVAPQPTVSDPNRAGVLGVEHLLTSEDAVYPNGGADWREARTTEGDGQATFSPCTQTSLSGLGARSVVQRDFEFVVTDTGDVEPTLTFNQIAGEFASDEAARTAYEEIEGWYADCAPPGSNAYTAGEWSPVPIDVDGEAQQMVSTYGPVDEELDPFGDEVWIMDTGLVLTGDRISVLTQVIHGQDYNWEETPVQTMLPIAADRLAEDGPAESPTQTPDEGDGGSAATTAIPDDVPIDTDLVDVGSDGDYHPPSHATASRVALELCGVSAWPPSYVDLFAASATGPEYADTRELVTLATVDEAVTTVDAVRGALADCPGEGNSVWTVHEADTGYDSVSFSRTYTDGLGAEVLQATRVGNAVLFTVIYGEGTLESVPQTLSERTALTRSIAPSLCVFTADGC